MYKYQLKDGNYFIFDDEEFALTPTGNKVHTSYELIAKKLTEDLNKYGNDPSNPISLVAFHFAMIDFFATMPREELERSVAIGLDRENDWTFSCPTATPEPLMKWWGLFGRYSDQAEKGKEWLATLSLMQLCAVCIIGRGLESVNIPFIVATEIEPKAVKSYAKEVVQCYPYIAAKELNLWFENFLFYFNVEKSSLCTG